MEDKKRVAIIGAGFGFALARALIRAGRAEVTLYERDGREVDYWNRLGYSTFKPWMERHPFAEMPSFTLLPLRELGPWGYDFTILAVPVDELKDALEFVSRVDTPEKVQGSYILVQKGLLADGTDPVTVARKTLPNGRFMTFTGAAFSVDMAEGYPVGMLLTCSEHDRPLAVGFLSLFKESNVWTAISHNWSETFVRNAMRTVTSLLQGMTSGYLTRLEHDTGSTFALANVGLINEYRLVSRVLGNAGFNGGHADRILEADLGLCGKDDSRNFAAGQDIGQGIAIDVAVARQGTVESVRNVGAIVRSLEDHWPEQEYGKWRDRLPYLSTADWFLTGQLTLVQCCQTILERQKQWFDECR